MKGVIYTRNTSRTLTQVINEACDRLDKAEIGFDPFDCADRVISAIKRTIIVQKDGFYAVSCCAKDLTEEHKNQINRILQTLPFVYATYPGEYLHDNYEWVLTVESPEAIDQHRPNIACFLAGERNIGLAISKNETWLDDPEHLSFVIGMCYLMIRAYDTSSLFQQTVDEVQSISQTLSESAGIRPATLIQKKEMQEKLIRVSALADISKSFLNMETLYKSLSSANALCNQLQSKISSLESALAAKDAAQRLAVANNEQKILYLEQQIEEKNKQLSGLTRIDELERRLDEASTKAQMMQTMLRQEREKASKQTTATPIKAEDLAAIELESMRIIMVGGNLNFRNKLKQRFPGWTILGEDMIRMRPSKVDIVLYNYLHCSHRLYNCGKQMAAQSGAIEIYVENTNIDKFEEEVRRKISEVLNS
ncbi:hypothetical protein DXA92_08090 [Agathobaculum butyriciproducens]|nr:hypothetical protein DXA94_02980 [Agathobaculum butyriciproducens]RGC60892.1 hypothetical protein DXA92_08090 [Agathobaculum butyriciproducens]